MTPIKNEFFMDDYLTMQALSSFNNSLQNAANVYMVSQTNKQDRKFSREMSDLAWERNLEAWRMQNEYNTPANQYARQLEGLRINGLNPNLVYGSSSSIGGSAGSVSPYKFENYHSTAVPRISGPEPIQDLLSTRLLQTQVAAQEANNRLLNARADNEEARNPLVVAKSDEASHRWNFISNNIIDNYDEAVKAGIAQQYWSGVRSEFDAERAQDARTLSHYEATMAEWLNETFVPGTNLTYRQYLEQYRVFLSKAQYDKVKEETLNLTSQIMYRKKQGEMLDLKKIYQEYVNKFARYGRAIGNDWVSAILTGIMAIFGDGDKINGKTIPEWWNQFWNQPSGEEQGLPPQ